MEEGNQHVDRNAQFEHINSRVAREMRVGNPVVSVDTKKKELVENYKSDGRRLWKLELQRLADELRFAISVCHFPPGTSKWNKVEHRLFSFISTNWRGEPLTDYETIVRLIANTTTATGLQVTCRLDRRKYAVGRKISDEEMKRVKIVKDKFHGEWNYTLLPVSQ